VGHDDSRLETEVDRLYQLPLKAFTQERNALAARLREGGDAEAAERVKSLAKPPVSAWAVNQVYWTARRDFDELIDASDRLRALQARGVTPNELRDVMRERRDALGAALRRGQAALAGQGHGANASVTQRLATSLEALAAYGSGRPPEIQPGRLSADVDPPGFEALAAVPAPRPLPPRAAQGSARPEPDADTDAEQAERLRLEREVASRKRRAQDARSAADELARRAEGARRELDEAERRLSKAKERAQEADAAAEKADGAARQAAEEVSAAERALGAAGGTRGPEA
jgi:hypothetical protein